jgi:hypothetical protein
VRLARQLLELVGALRDLPDLRSGQDGVRRPAAIGVERHELDEPDLVVRRSGQLTEAQHLALGEVAHRDRIHLDGPHLRERGDRLQPTHHLGQGVPAGDPEERVSGQRVHRHVEPIHPRLHQRAGIALEQVAVRGDRDLAEALGAAQHRDQLGELPADQWLAPGQPQIADAHRREQPNQPLDLLEGQDLGAIEPGEPVGWHAVLAAEVAAIHHRDAQVLDQPAVPVAKRFAAPHR